MKSVKKISVKTVCGAIKRPEVGGKPWNIMRVLGVADALNTGTSQYGDWVALLGQFKATDIATGEIVYSGVCLLPEVAVSMIATKVKELISSGQGGGVEFACEIIVTPDQDPAKPTVQGYSYAVEWIGTTGRTDPLASLEMRLLGNSPSNGNEKPQETAPAAPAPSPESTPTPETTVAPVAAETPAKGSRK